jgi:hypothetical protein
VGDRVTKAKPYDRLRIPTRWLIITRGAAATCGVGGTFEEALNHRITIAPGDGRIGKATGNFSLPRVRIGVSTSQSKAAHLGPVAVRGLDGACHRGSAPPRPPVDTAGGGGALLRPFRLVSRGDRALSLQGRFERDRLLGLSLAGDRGEAAGASSAAQLYRAQGGYADAEPLYPNLRRIDTSG